MSEENKVPPPPPMPKEINLHVMLNTETNQVQVRGPIHLKLLCIKILTNAIGIICDQPAIIPHHSNGAPSNGKPPPLIKP